MRRKIIAGNWKMNTDHQSALALAQQVAEGVDGNTVAPDVDVVICPPFVFLETVKAAIQGSRVKLGAQNLFEKESGAYTGEISGRMLKSIGCEYVIAGHSERRLMFAESDRTVRDKVKCARAAGLIPIICVGETSTERSDQRVRQVVASQVKSVVQGIDGASTGGYIIAYEPVWAIGTGNTATPQQAEEVHLMIRETLASLFGDAVAQQVSILYGGSMNAANADELLAQPNVDGGLIGGASLKGEEFLSIVRSACAVTA